MKLLQQPQPRLQLLKKQLPLNHQQLKSQKFHPLKKLLSKNQLKKLSKQLPPKQWRLLKQQKLNQVKHLKFAEPTQSLSSYRCQALNQHLQPQVTAVLYAQFKILKPNLHLLLPPIQLSQHLFPQMEQQLSFQLILMEAQSPL